MEERKEAGLYKATEKGDGKIEVPTPNEENAGSFLANAVKEEMGSNPTIKEADDYLEMVMR